MSKRKKPRSQDLDRNLRQINLNAAGIDIGADRHWVSVPLGRDDENVRSFACFTSDLYTMADWLKKCGIETVAMESTGVYWIPVFQILESRGFEVKLVNAHYVKTVPGRKTDVLDCQWLQQLHTYGLLSGSFRPEDQICALRSYIRQRDNLIKSACVHVQRMQKALTQMNIQLHRVISDITGTTGLSIIRGIVSGERNPIKLAALKDGRIKASKEKIAASLTGDYRPELVFILQQELKFYEFYQSQIADCDNQVEQCLASFTDKVDITKKPLNKPKRRGKKQPGNAPQFDLRTHLYRISGVDFTQVDGFGALTVLILLSELGLDPSRFPTVKHFTSWLGLCPSSRVTGGKVKSSKTRPVANRAANAFRMAAQTLSRSHSALGAYYRRMQTRLGAPKAITAAAHKLARIFYHLWTSGGAYTDPGINAYEQQYHDRMLKNLKKKAQAFGLELIPISNTSESVDSKTQTLAG
ncbi:IS110 family RNA-guided transposase [Mastigocoleus testarum]|uniref:Transposase n=1 Tax=Mastigocoleus testarum BC008 TaxID=371196 RepID=A0A0V8A164_9CYAN|nr:IS110 family transposase [Mastigocoleus testarum]KST70326.1 transposase [Mastigocoleus testarum BC008]